MFGKKSNYRGIMEKMQNKITMRVSLKNEDEKKMLRETIKKGIKELPNNMEGIISFRLTTIENKKKLTGEDIIIQLVFLILVPVVEDAYLIIRKKLIKKIKAKYKTKEKKD